MNGERALRLEPTVSPAAIQGLHHVVREKESQIESLEKTVLELRQALNALAERLDRTEGR